MHIGDTSIVKYFNNVFPDDLPCLPLDWEIEFTIELVENIKPIFMAPYWMTSVELKELKVQLKGLISRGFVCPNVSSWGTPILFVKKNDEP